MAEEAGEKTEEPSSKRLEDARKKGNVPFSRDLTAGTVYIVVFMSLAMTAETWFKDLLAYFRVSFVLVGHGEPPSATMFRGLTTMAGVLKAPLLGGMLAALAVGFLQTGGNFSTEALKIDPQRLMPNFKKLVSPKTLVEVLKGFVKVTLAAAAAWAAVKPILGALSNLTGTHTGNIVMLLGYATAQVGNRIVLVVAVIGVADTLWQRHSHMKGLRMTREELKKEYKESEGDPHHKAERKRFHKELLEQRMVNEVKKANFVVVNPTHIAVAIKYDRETDPAPTVLAKGEMLLAERIKQAAQEYGIPIFRDVGLARALREVEEGDEIPEALYEAVAEILRSVYQESAPPSAGPPGASAGQAEESAAVTTDAPRGTWQRA